MKHRLYLAAILLLCLAGVTAQPAGASNTALGSIHETDQDFQNATQLSNVVVSGTGDSAVVGLGPPTTYNPVVDEGDDGTTDVDTQFIGDSGSGFKWDSEHRIQPTTTGDITQLEVNIGVVRGSDYGFTVDIYLVQEAPDQTYGEGILIRQDWDPDFQTGLQTINITNTHVQAGNTYTIEFVTNQTDGDSTQDALEIALDNSAGTTWFTNSFDGAQNQYSDITASIQRTPGTYISANHDTSNVESGFTDLSLTNATATVSWQQNTGSGWSDLRTDIYSSSGNHSVSIPSSTSNVRVNVTFQATGPDPTASLHDEGVQFTNHDPRLDNASAEPQGDPLITQKNPKLNISVADPEFPTAQGDNVDVEFYVDGSSIGTDTLTSNGTAEVSWSDPTGGSHTWHAEASDNYGGSKSSDTFQFHLPNTIEIRNETAPNGLINDTEITVQFYPQGTTNTVTRTTTDGSVSLSGLPTNQVIIATATADGYFDRRIAIEPTKQQTIYLVNNSVNVVQPQFDYQDFTGRYPPEGTIVQIQQIINGEWRTVEGDYVGATEEFPAQLRYNIRHRIRIENTETENSRLLGSYVPVTSGVKSLRVLRDGSIEIADPVSTNYIPSVRSLTASDSVEVGAELNSETNALQSYNVSAVLRDSGGTTVLFNLSGSKSAGERLTQQVNLSGSAGGNVTVRIGYSTGSVSSIKTSTYGVSEAFQNQYSLINILTGVPNTTTESFTTLFAVIASVLVTAAVASQIRMSTEAAGLVAVGFITGFALLGWVPLSLLFVAGAAWVAFTALVEGL